MRLLRDHVAIACAARAALSAEARLSPLDISRLPPGSTDDGHLPPSTFQDALTRPLQVWLRDSAAPGFIAEAARQARLVAAATREDELDFLDHLADELGRA